MSDKKHPRKISRRSFVKLAGGAALTGAAVGLTGWSEAAHAADDALGDAKGVLVDIPKCIGCESCSVACKIHNKLEWKQEDQAKTAEDRAQDPGKGLNGSIWTSINLYKVAPKGSRVKNRFVKTQCFHCQDPACVAACFAKAFQKTPEGPVVYDQGLCVGCRYCMMACPFNIIKYEWEKSIPGCSKCRMCYDRVMDGEEPACVSVCPSGALTYGTRSALLRQARERVADRGGDVSYIPHIYGEKEAGGTSWLYISDVPFEEMRFRTDVPVESIPSYSEDYMKMTPLVGGAWAVVLGGIYWLRNKGKEHLD
ncbi:MAG: 4Fe-4S dicluster domain-containing protein [Peptococcaceae bacterium]|nr:4Fe-4S dicluster domain-containing protein [Peptococcaceae bacterium]